MLDDLATATTAHGLQLHPTRTQRIFNTTSTTRKNNTAAVQEMNMEILPSEGKIKYLRPPITFTNAVQVGHGHPQDTHCETDSKLFDAGVTPSLFYASATWTMTQEMKKKLKTTTTTDDQDNQKTKSAVAHDADVDEVADDEPHNPQHEGERDTVGINLQDSNPSSDSVPKVELEDEREPWVDHIARATHNADDLLAANGITSCIPRHSRIYWEPARMIAKHHEGRRTKTHIQLEPSDINQAEKDIGSKEDQPGDGKTTSIDTYDQPVYTDRDDNDLANDTTWLAAAQQGLKCDSMDSDCVSSRLKSTNKTHDPDRHDNDNQTSNSRKDNTHTAGNHDHDEVGADDDEDDDTLLILYQLIESWSSRRPKQ